LFAAPSRTAPRRFYEFAVLDDWCLGADAGDSLLFFADGYHCATRQSAFAGASKIVTGLMFPLSSEKL
jgi:hypothetical protein